MYLIKNRHTGEVLIRLPARSDGTLRSYYLGHRHPKDLRSADLRGLDLSDADVTGRDLSDADLTGAILTGTRYDDRTVWPRGFHPERHGAVRVPLDLKGAKLSGEDFSGKDLSGADLRGADLSGAKFVQANLTRTKLRGAKLNGADFAGADLTEADLVGVGQDEQTRWPDGFDPRRAAEQSRPPAPPTLEQVVVFLKALADPTRLRLLGVLSEEELTGEELAATLGLSEATISHHVGKLREQGLVTTRPEGTRRYYRLDRERLDESLRALPDQAVRIARGRVDGDTFDQKVLKNYFENGRLKTIPFRLKKLHVVLRRLARDFEHGVEYPEKRVNEMLGRYHPDFATLRRNLVDYRYMERQNGIYRRLPDPTPPADADGVE